LSFEDYLEAAPPFEAQPQKNKAKRRKGGAFPHCAAAEPLSLTEWRIGVQASSALSGWQSCVGGYNFSL
jgi:hypothetical protein